MSKHDFIEFYHYPTFEEELQDFIDDHTSSDYTAQRTIKETENLLQTHFCKFEQFSPKSFNLAQNTGALKIYFLKKLVILAFLKKNILKLIY